ncbi:TlpA family protein disulfide reductase [Xanthomonas albilineans]|uniref:Putative redoxin protein n=1 Tax=Xanthomonas albilineans (strain GPE PC73 / CFBP 7063) TaxID=380358 RepID=D2UAQ4_XANAP|nr:TlpA disulfide reductase family protein [Xanthomonas albilineans]QHQ27057.1 putative redoxin protein [Xanthomonas albilineans]CBA14857.1 putative redoxin protein [Xanthomonas albilineans GPE PC73]
MTATPRRLLVVAAVAAVLGMIAAQGWQRTRLTRSIPAAPADDPAAHALAARPGEHAPTLRLTTLNGERITLGQFHGRPLLINVWASWCEPCVREMPELERLARRPSKGGLQVLGIALDRVEDVRAFLQRVPIGYPIALETPGPTDASVRLGDTRGLLPYSVLIDADGRIVKQKLGPFAAGEAERWTRDSSSPAY